MKGCWLPRAAGNIATGHHSGMCRVWVWQRKSQLIITVHFRLSSHLGQHKLQSNKQFGFEQLHSNEDALSTMIIYIKTITNKCVCHKRCEIPFDSV